MNVRQLRRQMAKVRAGIESELAAHNRDHNSHFARGLSREGYEGGYLQALTDVESFLGGFTDCNSRHERKWRT